MNVASGGSDAPGPRLVREERALLCDALAAAGPGAPTECAGWTALDLAAHLIVRERRPDAAAGLLLRPLAAHNEAVRRRTAARIPFAELVNRIRTGPPKWSVYSIPGVDKNANSVEFFVHHEDVRRAVPDWEPRPLSPGLEDLLWRRIKIARFALRKVPVEVTLVRPDGRDVRVSSARSGAPGRSRMPPARGRAGSAGRPVGQGHTPSAAGGVRVHGAVGELVLWALGRTEVAEVRITGAPDAVNLLEETGWRL
jgi:uncharacterized protein (TIGR03085 family)